MITLEERFWNKVEVREENDCWPWVATKNRRGGYGKINVSGRMVLAHRLSWELANEQKVPEGLCILHSCHNKDCVNPAHLRVGTKSDNTQDMLQAGRGNDYFGKGVLHPKAKLTEEQVLAIRAENGQTQRELARIYGVHHSTIWDILNRKKWLHI